MGTEHTEGALAAANSALGSTTNPDATLAAEVGTLASDNRCTAAQSAPAATTGNSDSPAAGTALGTNAGKEGASASMNCCHLGWDRAGSASGIINIPEEITVSATNAARALDNTASTLVEAPACLEAALARTNAGSTAPRNTRATLTSAPHLATASAGAAAAAGSAPSALLHLATAPLHLTHDATTLANAPRALAGLANARHALADGAAGGALARHAGTAREARPSERQIGESTQRV